MSVNDSKLTVKEKIGYGLGDTASNIVFQVVANFMLIFYTDVFGISAAAAGTLMLVVRLFDGFTDPVMGGVADRTRSKWGSYRPYLLFMAIPYGVLAVVAFTVPDFTDNGKLIYAYITYALLMLLYTSINIPYSALGGVMTNNPKERASLQSFRFAMAMAGMVIVVAILPQLVTWFGQGDQAKGYQYAMSVLAVLAVVCFLLCFKLTKEKPSTEPLQNSSSMLSDFGSLFKNDQWVLITAISVALLALIALRGAITPHYVKYFLGDESLTASFMTLGGIASAAGAVATIFLSKRFGKKPLFIAGLTLGIISHALLYVLPATEIIAIYIIFIVANFVHMIVTPLLFSMVADTVDYGTKLNGRRLMAMTFSGHLLGIKLGFAIGGASAGWILAYTSYVPNQAQTEEALNGLLFAFAGAPVIFLIISLILIKRYKLTESVLSDIQAELKQSETTPKPGEISTAPKENLAAT
ncbi:glycoside-pentoside-hexuronide (GPH):cation symporter [Algibacillus agarilyticus]|uniref:glycoside-pentoside-hexuronide (GPH):cation symporter n=1 Tax=Algibacillus agarilyticus TaxID=2234133 RepID=UPI000DD00A89|nr:glycoside-pentoside-hexuronide (GPH):cation symporter [Algibacillus agarilyticus]